MSAIIYTLWFGPWNIDKYLCKMLCIFNHLYLYFWVTSIHWTDSDESIIHRFTFSVAHTRFWERWYGTTITGVPHLLIRLTLVNTFYLCSVFSNFTFLVDIKTPRIPFFFHPLSLSRSRTFSRAYIHSPSGILRLLYLILTRSTLLLSFLFHWERIPNYREKYNSHNIKMIVFKALM